MKKIKILTITLIIALITMVSLFGVYVQVQNRMENEVKQYEYAMDLKGTRNLILKPSTGNTTTIKDSEGNVVEDSEELTDEEIAEKGYTKEETPYNTEEVLNKENYEKSKNIIEERLKKLEVQNYTIKTDETTGNIILEIEENDDTDRLVSNIATAGKFEIVDTQTQEVLMTNEDIKLSNVMYGSDSSTGTTQSGTAVYLNIEFTNEGKQKLENISSTYVEIEETTDTEESEDAETTDTETTEAENTEDTEEEKTITMKIDDEEIMSTSFSEPLRTGKLQLSIGQASTDQETLQGYIEQASSMATILDSGNTPVRYEVDENKYVLTDITNEQMQIVKYVIAAIALLAIIVLIIRFKTNGLLGAISYIGLVSLFLLLIRYANVILSIEGIFAIVIIMILNYIFVNKWLSKLKAKEMTKTEFEESMKETYKEFFIKIIPICIMVITFCFIGWTPISSFGMVMFWGITLIALYHSIITNSLLRTKLGK